MTPSAAFTKRVRYGAAVAGLAGILVFAGCSAETDASEETPAAATSESSNTSTARTTAASTGKYADGTYTASGSYQTPETVETIKDLLETRIRPAVAGDGGDITFRGYRDGTVYLAMKGSCSGCPSSTATLKHGIQNLLRHFLPDVREVEAI